MIRITIECLPMGDKSRAKIIAAGEIANVGGDLDIANLNAFGE